MNADKHGYNSKILPPSPVPPRCSRRIAQRCTSSLPLRGREQRVGVVASGVRRLKRAQARLSKSRLTLLPSALFFPAADGRRYTPIYSITEPPNTPREATTIGQSSPGRIRTRYASTTHNRPERGSCSNLSIRRVSTLRMFGLSCCASRRTTRPEYSAGGYA